MAALLDGMATFLLTYAMHSVIASVLALATSRLLRRPQDRDLVWKATFIAPILTSTATMVLSVFDDRGPFVDLARTLRRSAPMRLPGRELTVRILDTGQGADVVRHLVDPVATALSVAAVIYALCAISVGIARLVHRRRSLSRALAPRQRVGELRDVLPGTPISLSTAAELQSPVAFGATDICLPNHVMSDFTDEHRRSLIAHEVAHLERHDPAWFLFIEVLTALSAFQPLIVVVSRAFRRDVELICDEVAVRRTNDRTSMIGALARLASPFDPRAPIYGAATAYDGSPLVARATRIATMPIDAADRGRRQSAIAAVILLIALLCAAPVVSAAPRMSDFPRNPRDAVQKARAEGRVVTVDTNVVVDRMHPRVQRTVVRVQ